MNILINSAGRRVSLVQYFRKELGELFSSESKVFTTDLNPDLSPACRRSDGGFAIGRFADQDYVETLLSICIENQIRLIIPTIDPELRLLSENQEVFRSYGIEVAISNPSFIELCANKISTNQFFTDRGIKVAKPIDRFNPTFPLFIKPVLGSAGKDLYHIKDPNQISDYLRNDQFIWTEYIDSKSHQEYTLDLYYDRSGIIKCVVPRIRLRVRGGETSKGLTDKNTKVIETVLNSMGVVPGACGCVTLQLFRNIDDDTIIGIEINPRFGGGYPLSYLAGANFPRWILQEYLLKEEIPFFESWENNLLLLRYDQEMVIHDIQH